ncbi:hypothetical protein TWF730_005823 [Orbilia blumenaviensis]|uniref:F-box domain-containing protein n=1 Tax=Orbilia blumenaviensis TaxID=1796055 RepID=A0AAV9VJH4_9PEZI
MGTNLLDLPTEIHLYIIKYLPPAKKKIGYFSVPSEGLRNFARTSRYFYGLTFPRRFKSVILGPAAVEVFQDGGLGEHHRGSVRALRFEKPWDFALAKGRYGVRAVIRGPDRRLEYFTSICAAIEALSLDLFPNVKELYVSYAIPKSAAENVLLAVLRGIAQCGFKDALEHLEVQVLGKSWTFDRLKYQEFHWMLSDQHKKLLGKVAITRDRLEELVKAEIPPFPALKTVKILNNSVANPLDSFKSYRFVRTPGYYLVLTLAPQLRELEVWTHKGNSGCETPEDYGCGCDCLSHDGEYPHPPPLEFSFTTDLLERFSNVTYLKVVQPFGLKLTAKEVEKLAERFPKLITLDLTPYDRGNREYLAFADYPLEEMDKLQRVEQLHLPWPTEDGEGSIDPDELTEHVRWWKTEGSPYLKNVTFYGARYKERIDCYQDIQVAFEFKVTGRDKYDEWGNKAEKKCVLVSRGDTSHYRDRWEDAETTGSSEDDDD